MSFNIPFLILIFCDAPSRPVNKKGLRWYYMFSSIFLYLLLHKCHLSVFVQYLVEKKSCQRENWIWPRESAFHKLENFFTGVVLCLPKIFVGETEFSRCHWLREQNNLSVTFLTIYTNGFEQLAFHKYSCSY